MIPFTIRHKMLNNSEIIVSLPEGWLVHYTTKRDAYTRMFRFDGKQTVLNRGYYLSLNNHPSLNFAFIMRESFDSCYMRADGTFGQREEALEIPKPNHAYGCGIVNLGHNQPGIHGLALMLNMKENEYRVFVTDDNRIETMNPSNATFAWTIGGTVGDVIRFADIAHDGRTLIVITDQYVKIVDNPLL